MPWYVEDIELCCFFMKSIFPLGNTTCNNNLLFVLKENMYFKFSFTNNQRNRNDLVSYSPFCLWFRWSLWQAVQGTFARSCHDEKAFSSKPTLIVGSLCTQQDSMFGAPFYGTCKFIKISEDAQNSKHLGHIPSTKYNEKMRQSNQMTSYQGWCFLFCRKFLH